MFFVDKWVHSSSLINVQPEENGMSFTVIPFHGISTYDLVCWGKTKRKYPTVIPFHGISTYDLVCWGKLLESKNCNAAPMWRFLCAMQLKCSSVGGRKKIGVDWPRPSQFRKKIFNVQMFKSKKQNNAATKRRGDGATWCPIDEATRQRSNAATDWRGDAATEQRGNGLTWRRICWMKICQSVECQKKLAWTDLDRVSFEKILQSQNVEIEKSAWTGLGKVKKGLFSGKCL
jgi:hypothetical protein